MSHLPPGYFTTIPWAAKSFTSVLRLSMLGTLKVCLYPTVSEELRLFTAQYDPGAWASWGDYDAKQLTLGRGISAELPHLPLPNTNGAWL